MKGKTIIIIAAGLLALGSIAVGVHHANSSEMCPLGKAIHGK